jgi:hypothetical protein
VQIGDERYRVIGIMEEKGQFLGIDLDDTAFIPTARGLALFKRDGLMEIGLSYEESVPAARVVELVKRSLIARHGREDFTIAPRKTCWPRCRTSSTSSPRRWARWAASRCWWAGSASSPS